MTGNEKKSEISIGDQMKKFALESITGFQTVLLFGVGKRLGIFNYLKRISNNPLFSHNPP